MRYLNQTTAIAVFIGLLTLSGCSTAQLTAAQQMSLGGAKEVIQRNVRWIFSDGAADHDAVSVQFTVNRIEYYEYRQNGTMIKQSSCAFEDFHPHLNEAKPVGVGVHKGVNAFEAVLGCPDDDKKNWATGDASDEEEGNKIVAALMRWKISTVAEREAFFDERQTQFAAVANTYRNQNPKPIISEDVRRLEVIANAAVKEKRFGDAANAYEDALKLAPWWPEGQFNAALILSEIHYYNEAIEHMRNYLALAPGAPNARAAQDHIYAWQGELART